MTSRDVRATFEMTSSRRGDHVGPRPRASAPRSRPSRHRSRTSSRSSSSRRRPRSSTRWRRRGTGSTRQHPRRDIRSYERTSSRRAPSSSSSMSGLPLDRRRNPTTRTAASPISTAIGALRSRRAAQAFASSGRARSRPVRRILTGAARRHRPHARRSDHLQRARGTAAGRRDQPREEAVRRPARAPGPGAALDRYQAAGTRSKIAIVDVAGVQVPARRSPPAHRARQARRLWARYPESRQRPGACWPRPASTAGCRSC